MAAAAGQGQGRKWDLAGTSKALVPTSRPQPPVGYVAPGGFAIEDSSAQNKGDIVQIKHKRAWNTALALGKSIPMNMFMMWMMGNSLSLWTLMFLAMILRGPFTAMSGGMAAFDNIDKKESFLAQKAAFVAFNIVSLGLGVYKCWSIGLIPKSNSDFLEFVQQGENHEYAFGGYV